MFSKISQPHQTITTQAFNTYLYNLRALLQQAKTIYKITRGEEQANIR